MNESINAALDLEAIFCESKSLHGHKCQLEKNHKWCHGTKTPGGGTMVWNEDNCEEIILGEAYRTK